MITNELFCPNEESRKVMRFFLGRFEMRLITKANNNKLNNKLWI